MLRPLAGLSFAFSILVLPTLATAQWQADGNEICVEQNLQTQPVAIPDGAGGAIIVWIDNRTCGCSWDIYAQRIDASGNALWTPGGVVVCAANDNQEGISLISDGAGGAVLTWVDLRSGVHDIYAQHVSSTGASLWTIDGVPVCTAAQNQYAPDVCADGAGGCYVTWSDRRTGGDYDIYAQRLGASGSPVWLSNGVPLCVRINTQISPQIVSSLGGSALVAWEDGRPNVTSEVHDIYAQRVDASGIAQWTTNGVPLCTASNKQEYPVSVGDGDGGAIVAWSDWRDGLNGPDIYAQRVDASGGVQWATNGVPICATSSIQKYPAIAGDDADGAIIVWEDARDGARIRAQRVDPIGTALWALNGIVLAETAGAQHAPDIAVDGMGGAIVTWTDWSDGWSYSSTNIFAQRLDALGNRQWGTSGAAVCDFDSTQDASAIVPNGDGGAIVAWFDRRNDGLDDIYALRLGPLGLVPTGVRDGSVPAPPALSLSYPNPFSQTSSMTLRVARESSVTMDVFDVQGKRIRRFDPRVLGAGEHVLEFNGRDDDGGTLPSGVYFCRVMVGDETTTRKVVIKR